MISLSALTFLRLIQFYSDTHVRLTGHNTTFAGRVEVFSHGVWGRVTDGWPFQWRKKEADVVCRQLGFPAAITAVRHSAFGEGSGPVVMSRVKCLGTENTLQQCQFQDWIKISIYTGQDVGVICKTQDFHPDNSDIQIRLQGSTLPNAGRVEVLYAGVWGAISSSSWDMNDALVVCRQLGYPAGAETALKNGVYGLVRGPVWVTNLQCTGSESNVMKCIHDGLGNKTELQYRTSFTSVICKDPSFSNGMTVRLRGSDSPNMGRVEVHYAGIWRSIYAAGWDIKDATVACRQLGYYTASLSGYRLFCFADDPHWFTNFQCNGNETSLDQCARDFNTYYSYGYCANVVCTDKTPTNAGSELRLRGSPVPHAGRVELRYKGIWGTIYFPSFFFDHLSLEATRVICRQLGFADGILSFGWSVFGPGEGPHWFRSYQLQCLGNETDVMNCSYTRPRFTIIDHRHDASVVCKPNDSQTNDIQVRITGSSLPFAGTIEVLYYGVWGGILGYTADIRVGHVICRQLGYSGAGQIFNKAVFGRVRGPLWISDIQCNGNETDIVHCAVTTMDKVSWHNHRYWPPEYAAAVLCNETNYSSSKAFNVRLVGAPIANAGRVEVFYAGVWGTIRGWNWDINDAHVVCSQLGYPRAISYGYSNQFGIGNGPAWLTNVRCLGNESSFEECPKRFSGYPNTYIFSVATALCKLPSQAAPSQDCSNIKCLSNGTCINTAFGPICNCTDGFTGPHCEIQTFEQCKSSPCENGGHCFSDGSSFLCNCPKGLTGQHCKEKILVASNPCRSHPCSNNSSCYHNKTHYTCISNTEGSSKTNVKSTPIKEKEATNTYLIVGLSVCALLVVVLATVNGYLILKNRQLTKRQPNNPRAVFSNRAYRADSENQLDDVPADDVDLGTMATHGVMSPKPAIYEDLSRPLPPIPPQQTRRTEVPRSTAMQTNGTGIYDNGSATEQAERHYMGLSAKNGTTARPHVTDPGNNYMSLSPEIPEAIAYSALNSALPKTPGRKQHGNNGRKRQERHKM